MTEYKNISNFLNLVDSIKEKIKEEDLSIIIENSKILSRNALDVEKKYKEECLTSKIEHHVEYLQEKITTDKKCNCGENDVCLVPNKTRLSKCKNFRKFLKQNPILNELYYRRNYEFTNSPNFELGNENYDEKIINLLNLLVLSRAFDNNKHIFFIAIFDYLMANTDILLKNPHYATYFHQLLDELVDKMDFDIYFDFINYNKCYLKKWLVKFVPVE